MTASVTNFDFMTVSHSEARLKSKYDCDLISVQVRERRAKVINRAATQAVEGSTVKAVAAIATEMIEGIDFILHLRVWEILFCGIPARIETGVVNNSAPVCAKDLMFWRKLDSPFAAMSYRLARPAVSMTMTALRQRGVHQTEAAVEAGGLTSSASGRYCRKRDFGGDSRQH